MCKLQTKKQTFFLSACSSRLYKPDFNDCICGNFTYFVFYFFKISKIVFYYILLLFFIIIIVLFNVFFFSLFDLDSTIEIHWDLFFYGVLAKGHTLDISYKFEKH